MTYDTEPQKIKDYIKSSPIMHNYTKSKMLKIRIDELIIYNEILKILINKGIHYKKPVAIDLKHLNNKVNYNEKYNKISYDQMKRIINKLIKKGIIERFTTNKPIKKNKFRKTSYFRIKFIN